MGVLSFPFEFPTEQAAANFVRQVAKTMGVPCLRDGCLVHVIVTVGRDIDDLVEIAKSFMGRPQLR